MILTKIGAVLLAITAIVHAIKGYSRLREAMHREQINLPRFTKESRNIISADELKFSWLVFSSHLLVVSGVLIYISSVNFDNQKMLLGALAIIPIVDSLILKLFTKEMHLGVPMLFCSGLLILIGITT